jgi:hypothetical protein
MAAIGVQNSTTDPTVTISVSALLRVMSAQCGARSIADDPTLSAAILGLTDAQTEALVRQLLAVAVHVSP